MNARKLLLAIALAALAAGALAQAWPRQSIRILVGSPPGGGTDAVARALADALAPLLGQPVVVENRPGASNTLAADAVAKSSDGHSLLMGVSTAQAIAPHLLRLPYDNERDLLPVAYVGAVPNVLVVNPQLAAHSVAQLLALARLRPGELNYASSGAGSTQHVAAELFKDATGAFITHIPYRGSGAALVDLMSGQVQLGFETLASALGPIRSGRLRALALCSATRSALLPDVPTLAQAGVPGVEIGAWYGIYMPAHTDAAVAARVNAQVNQLLATEPTRTRLAAIGAELKPMSMQQFRAFHDAENRRYAALIGKKNIRID